MADENSDSNERTEDPTPKRLEEAIRRGDVARSIEVNTWFMIAGGTLMIMMFGGSAASSLQAMFRGLLAKSYQIPTDGPALIVLVKTIAFDLTAALGIPLVLLLVAAFAGNLVQHRLLFTTEQVMPQLSRIIARRRLRPAVLAAGAGQSRQGHSQARRRRRGDGGFALAAA